jgi:hypothetical protein
MPNTIPRDFWGSFLVKTIGQTRTHIDYLQTQCNSPKGWNRFGVRVEEGRCVVIVKSEDGPPVNSGMDYPLPVKLESLPSHTRLIVEDYLLNCPSSDLAKILAGKKTFQEALDSGPESEVKPVRINQKRDFRIVLNGSF